MMFCENIADTGSKIDENNLLEIMVQDRKSEFISWSETQ